MMGNLINHFTPDVTSDIIIQYNHNDSDTQQQEIEIDLTIFTNLNTNQCRRNNHSNDDYSYIENCDYLKRIAVALKYYHAFRQNKMEDEAITQFFQNTYTNTHDILNDHIHFISEHNYDLLRITKEIEVKYGLKSCHIDECDVIERHYRQRTKEAQSDDDGEEIENFMVDSFDRLHHHLYHTHPLGLRSNISTEPYCDDTKDYDMIDTAFKKTQTRDIYKKR